MSKPPAPSDIADKFMLRLPEGMRDRLKAAAERSKRSMNAEIVARLETTLGIDVSTPEQIVMALSTMQKELSTLLDRNTAVAIAVRQERDKLNDEVRAAIAELDARRPAS